MADEKGSKRGLGLLDALRFRTLSDQQFATLSSDGRSFEEVFGELGPAMRSLHAGHIILDLINQRDDRSAAIIGQAFVEELVRRLVTKALLPGKESRQLLALDGPLGAFTPRVKLAVTLGLIDSKFADMLRQMAVIRNAFAHNFEIDTFEELSPECEKLRSLHRFSTENDGARQDFHLALFAANHTLAKALHRATPREFVGDGPLTGVNGGIE